MAPLALPSKIRWGCGGCGLRGTWVEGSPVICPACGGAAVSRDLPATDDLLPREAVPFSFDASEAAEKVRAWLGTGRVVPSDLAQRASLDAPVPLYVPHRLFDGTVEVSWQGQVRRRTGKRGHVDLFREGRRSLSAARRPSAATDGLPAEALALLEPWSLEEAVAVDAGVAGQGGILDPSAALADTRESFKERLRDEGRQLAIADLGRGQILDLRVDVAFREDQVRSVLLPVYVLSWRYDDKPYLVLVNGQTGEVVGERPVDPARVAQAQREATQPYVLFGLLGLVLIPFAAGVPMLFAAVILGLQASTEVETEARLVRRGGT